MANKQNKKADGDNKINDSIKPRYKIKVFISSICGKRKYDKIRADLKKYLEDTGIITVYTFEDSGASTLSAKDHYLGALKDSDVCIFLIDNKDGILQGVQNEIDCVQKNNIFALYYFCDEHKKRKTAFESSMLGASYAKSQVVHSFNDLAKDSAQAMIDNIVEIYHMYCHHEICKIQENEESEELRKENDIKSVGHVDSVILKRELSVLDKSTDYIMRTLIRQSIYDSKSNIQSDNVSLSMDDYVLSFLRILIEHKSIDTFDISEFISNMLASQDIEYTRLVTLRWKAIKAYYKGNIDNVIKYLEEAIEYADNNSIAKWVINDVLIDLRNVQLVEGEIKNNKSIIWPEAQERLDSSDEPVYYPVMDRIQKEFKSKFVDGLNKKKVDSPYSITISNDLSSYGRYMAQMLEIAMCNGSLTYILSFYNNVKDFLFYICDKYSDRNPRVELLKYSIYAPDKKKISGICDAFPEILMHMNSDEAREVMDFSYNNVMEYRRKTSRLAAFGTVGIYLDDDLFNEYEQIIMGDIQNWLVEDNKTWIYGRNIFSYIAQVSYRIPQNQLVMLCCSIFRNNLYGIYRETFKFIGDYIKIDKVNPSLGTKLLGYIINGMNDDNVRKIMESNPNFLWKLRKQDYNLTEELDKAVKELMPEFYNDIYKLESTLNSLADLPVFMNSYIEQIRIDNDNQGKNGRYYSSGTRYISTARNLIVSDDYVPDDEALDRLIDAVYDTLMISRANVNERNDAISLLISIVFKYPLAYERNKEKYQNIIEHREDIYNDCTIGILCNIDKITLKIGLCLLGTAIGKDMYQEFLISMPYVKDDIPSINNVSYMIREYLMIRDDIVFPNVMEMVILQNVLLWLNEEREEIRRNAALILLMMLRNPDNCALVNQKLVSMIDNESVGIKNLIQRQIRERTGITQETKDYIEHKCKNDSCYIVRSVYEMLGRGEVK